jgi:hypothetical protein
MIRLHIVTPADENYKQVQEFAQNVYDAKLHTTIYSEPDYFAVATLGENGKCVGCFGLYRADTHEPLLIETYFREHISSLITKNKDTPRAHFGELGTRAVHLPRELSHIYLPVSIALAGTIILFASTHGFRYLLFTANRSVHEIANTLGTKLHLLGKPDLSLKDPEFQKNWEQFFRHKQSCFGIDVLQSRDGCRRALTHLAEQGLIECLPDECLYVN